eukprot:11746262-Alexandrium_andersonii.AAC.1
MERKQSCPQQKPARQSLHDCASASAARLFGRALPEGGPEGRSRCRVPWRSHVWGDLGTAIIGQRL